MGVTDRVHFRNFLNLTSIIHHVGELMNYSNDSKELQYAIMNAAANCWDENSKHRVPFAIFGSSRGHLSANETGVVLAQLMAIEESNENAMLKLPNPLNPKASRIHQIEPQYFDCRSKPLFYQANAEDVVKSNCPVIGGCWESSARKFVLNLLEETENDCLLLYPVQYEGLEKSQKAICLGTVPNQQIYPSLDWLIESNLTKGRLRFLIVGSDYSYPRIAAELVETYLLRKGHDVPEKAEFVSSAPGRNEWQNRLLAKIKKARPDFILNFINGDKNCDLFELLTTCKECSGVKSLSFSLAESEIAAMKSTRGMVSSNHFLASSYSHSDSDGSFGKRFKSFLNRYESKHRFQSVHKISEITTEAMWNAYVGVHRWVLAARAAGSEKGSAVRPMFATIDAGEMSLLPTEEKAYEVCPETLHSKHATDIFRIDFAQDDSALLNRVTDSTDPLCPELIPDYGDENDWLSYSKLIWFTSDVIMQLEGKIPNLEEIREDVIASTEPPRRPLNAWAKIAPVVLRHQVQTAWEKFDDGFHNFESIDKASLEQLSALVIDALSLLDELSLSDPDYHHLYRVQNDLDGVRRAAKKIKAYHARSHGRVYLFDFLEFCLFAKNKHSFWFGSTAYTPRQNSLELSSVYEDELKMLLSHDDIFWRLNNDSVRRLFEVVAIPELDVEHSLLERDGLVEYALKICPIKEEKVLNFKTFTIIISGLISQFEVAPFEGNKGDATIAVEVKDQTKAKAELYTLSLKSEAYELTRESDGFKVTGNTPPALDGMEISIHGTIECGDAFSIRPARKSSLTRLVDCFQNLFGSNSSNGEVLFSKRPFHSLGEWKAACYSDEPISRFEVRFDGDTPVLLGIRSWFCKKEMEK